MKNLAFVALSFLSSVSMASGYICQGQGYSVKLYNEVQPSRGTKNPAILVVSTESSGLIGKLHADEIVKTSSEKAVTFSGSTHDLVTGRFISLRLDVVKAVSQASGFEGAHFARVTMKVDKEIIKGNMACAEYLKGRN